MATWNVSDLTWTDYLDIINDPVAFFDFQYSHTEWVPWTAEYYTTPYELTVQLKYVAETDPDPVPPLPFPQGLNLHLQFSLGFDHFKITPDIAEDVDYAAAWAACVKPGRYGRGLCVRLDSTDYFRNNVPTFFEVGVPGPGYFYNGDQMAAWAGNRLTYGGVDYPNGYDVILPFSQRAHIYQPPGQAWVLKLLNYYGGQQYDYITLQDGVLWGIDDIGHLAAPAEINGDVILAVVPDTINTWYSLEFLEVPDTPLVPAVSPAINPLSPSVNITFTVKINGVTYYTDAGTSAEPGNYGQHQLGYVSGKGALFIDNYYCAYMTQEGLPLLATSTWVIDSVEPVADACVGAWTGVDFETNTKFRGDYTNTIKMDNDDYLIQDVGNLTYDGLGAVVDGLYTKFHYDTPLPLPGTAVATYGVLLGDFFAPYGFPWLLQNKTGAKALRDINFPYLGVDNAPRYWHDDLYYIVGAGRTINQFMPNAMPSGVVQIGVDIKNHIPV